MAKLGHSHFTPLSALAGRRKAFARAVMVLRALLRSAEAAYSSLLGHCGLNRYKMV